MARIADISEGGLFIDIVLPLPEKTKVKADIKKTNTKMTEDVADPHLKTWNIQIGAFPTAGGAQSRLEKAMKKAGSKLRGKTPFTMKFAKGGDIFYRARFSGFTRRTAANACRTLTRKGVGCFALAPKS